jgi:hypothetical protein
VLVNMRSGIRPLCDEHRTQMQLVKFSSSEIAITMIAFKCMFGDCPRAYSNSFGYHFAADHVSFEDSYKRQCDDCSTFMYIANVEPISHIETWRCSQMNCAYSEQVNPDERFTLTLHPMVLVGDIRQEDVPFASIEAHSTWTGEKRSTGLQGWTYIRRLLGKSGRFGNQMEYIRQNLIAGQDCIVKSDEMSPITLSEKEIVRMSMSRVHSQS